MAQEAKADTSLTARQVDRLKAPMELDLIAFYAALEDEVMSVVDAAVREGVTPQEIIERVEDLFGAGDGPVRIDGSAPPIIDEE